MLKNHIIMNTHDGMGEIHHIGSATREWIVTGQSAPAFTEMGMYLAGWSVAGEGFVFVRHKFKRSQVLYCAGGKGEVWVNGAWCACTEGFAYLAPARAFHAYRALSGDTPWRIYWTIHHTPLVDGNRPALCRADGRPFMDAIENLYRESTGMSDARVMAQWTQILHTQAQRIVASPMQDPRLRRLWRRVEEAIDFPWTVAALAREAGVSDEHLRRLCVQELAASPMEQVAKIRMRYAVTLLVTGHYTVNAVAERVGYATPFAFSTAFKRHIGVAPSKYVHPDQSFKPLKE